MEGNCARSREMEGLCSDDGGENSNRVVNASKGEYYILL